jgi:hypothetical protein
LVDEVTDEVVSNDNDEIDEDRVVDGTDVVSVGGDDTDVMNEDEVVDFIDDEDDLADDNDLVNDDDLVDDSMNMLSTKSNDNRVMFFLTTRAPVIS